MANRLPRLILLLTSCALIATSSRGGDIPGEVDSLPGWMGVHYQVPKKPSKPEQNTLDRSRIIQLSADNPRAYLYRDFLTQEECDFLIATASAKLERSMVVASLKSDAQVSDIRTSSGSFVEKGANPVVKSIEQRITEWTFLPTPNQEPLQILRYLKGQKYVPHVDYFPDKSTDQVGGQRYATVLMYLSNVTLGGETVFSNVPDPTPKDDTWSDCAKGLLAVKPRKGDALLFFSMHPDGSPDPNSLHYACPVIKGVKWSAPKWIHVRSYETAYGDPNICDNYNAQCNNWAAMGECEKNPKYMVGLNGQGGACRKACGTCTQ